MPIGVIALATGPAAALWATRSHPRGGPLDYPHHKWWATGSLGSAVGTRITGSDTKKKGDLPWPPFGVGSEALPHKELLNPIS
jgi:hypothetical protein